MFVVRLIEVEGREGNKRIHPMRPATERALIKQTRPSDNRLETNEENSGTSWVKKNAPHFCHPKRRDWGRTLERRQKP